jgi:hypothetical protein
MVTKVNNNKSNSGMVQRQDSLGILHLVPFAYLIPLHTPNMGHILLLAIIFLHGMYVSTEPEGNCIERYPLIGLKKFENYKLVDAKSLQTVKLDCNFW